MLARTGLDLSERVCTSVGLCRSKLLESRLLLDPELRMKKDGEESTGGYGDWSATRRDREQFTNWTR